MASELDQFADLELSKEDREQIFDPPLDRQQLEGAGTSRYLSKPISDPTSTSNYKTRETIPNTTPQPPQTSYLTIIFYALL